MPKFKLAVLDDDDNELHTAVAEISDALFAEWEDTNRTNYELPEEATQSDVFSVYAQGITNGTIDNIKAHRRALGAPPDQPIEYTPLTGPNAGTPVER